jgi:hypothetical protein
MSQLSYARYGKDNVRLYKVDKDPKTGIHTIVEQTVRINPSKQTFAHIIKLHQGRQLSRRCYRHPEADHVHPC